MSNETENPNENCLDGFRCPECGNFGPFRIFVTARGMTWVTDEGTDGVEGGVEWDDDSCCECTDCGHAGKVREFLGKPAPVFDDIQQIVANAYDGGNHLCNSPDDIHHCADGLLTYLMVELSAAEDCDSKEEAIERIDRSIRQLEEVRSAIVDGTPLK